MFKTLITALSLLFAVTAVNVPATTASAAPSQTTTTGGEACTSQGKAWKDLDEAQCGACGGTWSVSSWGCGGGVLLGGIAAVGGLVTANPWVLIGATGALAKAADECQGSCSATVGS